MLLLSPVKNEYDYLEVMACPGGCTNGGGQITSMTPTEGIFFAFYFFRI